MTSKIEQVRTHLLDTLADLRNPDKPMDVERARAIAQVAGVLVDTAKVEVEFLRVTGDEGTGFLGSRPEAPVKPGEALPGVRTVHRLKG